MGDTAQKQLDVQFLGPEQQSLLDAMTEKLKYGGKRSPVTVLPWLEMDPSQTVSRWQEYIADPMMSAWERTAGPMSKRKYNLPGSFYSADASRGMMGDAEAYLSTNLFPSLYSSIENMYSRLASLLTSTTTTQTQGTDVVDKKYWSSEIGMGVGALFGMGG